MLYTSRPLERIYAPPSVFEKKRNAESENIAEDEYKEILLPNGRVITRRDGDNYVIERINSTDMNDYLNENYFPGKNMKE